MPVKSSLLRAAMLSGLLALLSRDAAAAPTSVAKNQDLGFGRISGGAGAAGTVTVDTSGFRTWTGGVVPLGTGYFPARFTITGPAGKTYSLTVPASLTISSGPDQMTVSDITASIPLSGVIPPAGALSFTVGGTLTVKNVQNNSAYSGNMAVTVK